LILTIEDAILAFFLFEKSKIQFLVFLSAK